MSKSSRIQSNLLQQNCFIRDVTTKVDLQSVNSDSVYGSLDEQTTSDGIRFKVNQYPYPITPSYVDSFVSSTDYHFDPASAVANGVKRSNLGDCTKFQDVLNMDSFEQRSLYEVLSAKFAAAANSNSVSESAAANSNSEVK